MVEFGSLRQSYQVGLKEGLNVIEGLKDSCNYSTWQPQNCLDSW